MFRRVFFENFLKGVGLLQLLLKKNKLNTIQN